MRTSFTKGQCLEEFVMKTLFSALVLFAITAGCSQEICHSQEAWCTGIDATDAMSADTTVAETTIDATTTETADASSTKCTAVGCDDKNPCTIDECDPKVGCAHTPNIASCDDGNACTTSDGCKNGWCSGTDLTCDDGNICTDDGCDPKIGCTHNPASWGYIPCDDGDLCTEDDLCKDGKCISGAPMVCDDNDPCTSDYCDKKNGCVYDSTAEDTSKCDDGNACTWGEYCMIGICGDGKLKDCNDGNECTYDSCDKSKGCVHEVAPAAKECNDSKPGTLDICDADGKCQHLLVDDIPKLQCEGIPAIYVPAEGIYWVQPDISDKMKFKVELKKGWVNAVELELVELIEPLSEQTWLICKSWPCTQCYVTDKMSTPSKWSCGAGGKGSGVIIPCPPE